MPLVTSYNDLFRRKVKNLYFPNLTNNINQRILNDSNRLKYLEKNKKGKIKSFVAPPITTAPLPEYYDEDDFQNRSSGEFNLSITNFSDTYYDIVTDFQNEAAGDYNTNITSFADTYYDIVTDFQNEAAGDYNTNITTIIVDP